MWLLASSGKVLIRYPCLASRAETFAMSLRGKADFVSDCRADERKSVRKCGFASNAKYFGLLCRTVSCRMQSGDLRHLPHSFMHNPSSDRRSSFPAWPDGGEPNQRKGIVIRIVERQRFWSRDSKANLQTTKQSADNKSIRSHCFHSCVLAKYIGFDCSRTK
jgi:hypothetical protein